MCARPPLVRFLTSLDASVREAVFHTRGRPARRWLEAGAVTTSRGSVTAATVAARPSLAKALAEPGHRGAQWWLFRHCARVPRTSWCVSNRSSWSTGGPRLPYWIAVGGLLSFLKGEDEEEEEEGKVPLSVKRALLTARQALTSQNFMQAEQAYHQALGLLMLSPHAASQPYIEATAVVLDLLANFYLEQGRLDEAEENFIETMKVMLAAGVKQNDAAIVEISLKLSKIYANQANFELAEPGFEWCIETAQKNCETSRTDDNLAMLGMCLQAKAQFHCIAGQDALASQAYTEALKVAEEVYGPSHLQVAVIHSDLAAALCGVGDFPPAEEHVRRSLEIAGSLEPSPEVREAMATFHCNLGVIQSRQGSVSEAQQSFQRAMTAAKRSKDRGLIDSVKFHTLQHTPRERKSH